MNFEQLLSNIRDKFPDLSPTNSRQTSPVDESYNCIAWAAGDSDKWWWPDEQQQAYWPVGIPRVKTIEAFERAYGVLGYTERTDAGIDTHKEKIAIYVNSAGEPEHAARQLPDGWWASKLGMNIDIEHELTAVEGPEYGTVAVILARPIATGST